LIPFTDQKDESMASSDKYTLTTLGSPWLASPAHAQTTLTMSSWAPPNHSLTSVVLQGFADEVEKASGGRLKFQMLPKHPVVGPETFNAVRDDLVDVSIAVTIWTPARHILARIAEFPGSGSTAEINSVAYSRFLWRHLLDTDEYQGVHLIGVFTHGPGQMFSTKRPIKSPGDLLGMKIRTGGGISEAMVRALGALAIVTSVPQECHELLSSGIADGAFFPQDSFVSFELQNLVRYATLFPGGFFNYSFGLFMNEAKWNRLSRQDRELITQFGGEYLARRAGKVWDEADRLGNEGMQVDGVQIDIASPAFVAEIQAKAQPMIDDWIKDVRDKRNMDGVKLLKEFKTELSRAAEQM
jgi:TRAP-type C4-dicarboxylate transport system substrate-binding protein